MSRPAAGAILMFVYVLLSTSSVCASTGGAAYKGTVFFLEHFTDTNFATRGWYEVAGHPVLTTESPAPGTTQVLQCRYAKGGRKCADGYPARIEIPETDAVYLSYWVRYSNNWVGSGKPYHPHEFHFTTNVDTKWIGPSNTHLTMYVEQVGLVPRISLQDSLNVDSRCILLNNGTWGGCNGTNGLVTKARSVASCNGIEGFVDGHDCYWTGTYWYSSRVWRPSIRKPTFAPGDWHFVETFFRMNDIIDGRGVANGSIRYWLDGKTLIESDHILFRTEEHPQMAFKYFLLLPWMEDGSPVEQFMWVGDITVARGVLPVNE